MIKEFNSLEEIQKYYDNETDTYMFKENGSYIDLVKFHFDLKVSTNIVARDIIAWDINAHDIYANDIRANEIIANDIYADNINAIVIKAYDISYYALCFAYWSINCKSIIGRRKNHKHFVFDGKLEVEEDE